jgi:beta-galactosidase
VNGERVGESHDWQAKPVFDVKKLLHPGTNVVAVVVANYNGAGGVNKGVALQIQESLQLPEWKRSVFNGLAQVIVQSSKGAGEIKLTARSAGLEPSASSITTLAVPLRPAMP